MKLSKIAFVISIVAVQCFFVKSQYQCTSQDLTLSDGVELQSGAVTLLEKNQVITFNFKRSTSCNLDIVGYKSMQMELTVQKFTLEGSEACDNSFVKIGVTDSTEDLTVCTKAQVGSSINSTMGTLYLTLRSTQNTGEVTLSIKSIQGPECGSPDIQLTKPIETITFPMGSATFNAKSECDITVKSIKSRPFKMNIIEINLDSGECAKDYMAAGTTELTSVEQKDKICKPTDVKGAISAPGGTMYLKIITSKELANAKVAVKFELEYPECGASEVEIPQEGLEITLPVTGKQFTTDTLCNIKFLGKNKTDFSMSIPKISFPAGTCQDDYISASTSLAKLPNTTYQKCGTESISESFKSSEGEIYVQIQTKSPSKDTMVTLKFQSGASKPEKYAFAAILLIHILKVAL